MLWPRTISSVCIIAVLIGAIFWAPSWIYRAVITFFALVGLAELVQMFLHKGWTWAVAGGLGGLIYVGVPYLALLKLHQEAPPAGMAGPCLVGFLLLVTTGCDIGAYLVGTSIGRRPLVPTISPKKTIEGSLGGLATSLVAAVVSKAYLVQVPWWQLALAGMGLGLMAQGGDLFESLLKRFCQVKDSGGFLPGLGGVLDTIDSVLFTAPVFYLVVRLMW